jgi:hypothetical integral membrane protein (TIGR02206 family)
VARGAAIRTPAGFAGVELWSPAHLAAIAATVLGAALLVACARRHGAAFAEPAARVLALVLLAGFAGEQLTYALRGEWSAEVNLPFQLTDAVTFVAAVALWTRAPLAVELTYFWALSATVQAVITPDVGAGFPDPLYLAYFASHSGAIAAACLLVFGMGRAPRPGAVPRVYAITAGFAAVAAVATIATGGNYMFLRRKPVRGSLLDVMGPWPVYIAVGAALALVLFLALAALARAVVGDGAARTAPGAGL